MIMNGGEPTTDLGVRSNLGVCLIHRDFPTGGERYWFPHRQPFTPPDPMPPEAVATGFRIVERRANLLVGRLRETPGFRVGDWYVGWFVRRGPAWEIVRVRTLAEYAADVEKRSASGDGTTNG
jgi:hypothetical protein